MKRKELLHKILVYVKVSERDPAAMSGIADMRAVAPGIIAVKNSEGGGFSAYFDKSRYEFKTNSLFKNETPNLTLFPEGVALVFDSTAETWERIRLSVSLSVQMIGGNRIVWYRSPVRVKFSAEDLSKRFSYQVLRLCKGGAVGDNLELEIVTRGRGTVLKLSGVIHCIDKAKGLMVVKIDHKKS